MAPEEDKEKEEETEEEKSEEEKEEEKTEDESEEETEDSSKKTEPEKTREQKIKDKMGFLKRRPDEFEKFVGMQVDIEEMQADHDQTKRELYIERAMKKHGLDDDVQELITGKTREQIDTSAAKIRKLIDKSAGKKGEKGRHEKPDLKDADDLEDSDNRDESEEGTQKRKKEAAKAMGFKRT